VSNLPVPVPRTFSAGETEVGAFLNAGVRDTGNYLLNVPGAYLTQSATQSLANSTWTAISFDQSVFDSYGGHSNVTNNTRYTAIVAGWYMVFGCVSYAGNASGNRGTAVAKNGTRVQGACGFVPTIAVGNSPTTPSPPCIVFLNVGDYVEIDGYQTSGGALATNSNSDLDSSMTIVWVHA
jgi:hypothetical protein